MAVNQSSSTQTETHKDVQAYYGLTIQKTADLQTGACCSSESMPVHIRPIIRDIDPEILDKFYGCGSPIPPAIDGCTVLDLGCGTGRDSYICSKLVGEHGRVIGVDMTRAQLDVAERHRDSHAQRFGFDASNVRFHEGMMEDLAAAGIQSDSVDVVISNCVINLAPDKERVFDEIFRVIKPGGELYFSDVFADRRLPPALMKDPVLVGECLAGAMYIEDFRRMLSRFDVPDFRVVQSRPLPIHNPLIERQLSPSRFYSITVRAFKLDDLEDRCEDYGQIATYKGTIEGYESVFTLDDHHHFTAHKPMPVCGNTASMLGGTRLGPHFIVQGDRSRHFGVMDACANGAMPAAQQASTAPTPIASNPFAVSQSTQAPGANGGCC